MIIKLHFNGELFRFSLEDETSFSAFSNHVRKLYLQGVDDVKLRWKDEDGDLVLLTVGCIFPLFAFFLSFSPFFSLTRPTERARLAGGAALGGGRRPHSARARRGPVPR